MTSQTSELPRPSAGGVNHSVLDNGERARIGRCSRRLGVSRKRAGAAIVASNIAAMLDGVFAAKPSDWSPLVYCWRGGQRSRSLTHVLNEVGWRAVQLDGGYRAYRRQIVRDLEILPGKYRYQIICGLTGSGKSRLIAALAGAGSQALDLEGMAQHRGSLLGDLPGQPQPTQKSFDSALIFALGQFDSSRPVYVESESKRIGHPGSDALLAAMRAGDCIHRAAANAAHRLLNRVRAFSAGPRHARTRLDISPRFTARKRRPRMAAADAGDWTRLSTTCSN